MNIHFDYEKLQQVLRDFYCFTGLKCTVFDGDSRHLITYPEEHQPFCATLREDERRCAACLASDRAAFRRAVERGTALTYCCHAGAVETVTPICFGPLTIGYAVFGQYIDEEGEYASRTVARQTAERYGMDAEALLGRYDRLPRLSRERMDAAASILQTCMAKLLMDDFIGLEHSALFRDVEKYIEAHIGDTLTVEALSAVFRMDRKTLYHLFRTQTGMTVRGYVMERRVAAAKHLLETTDETVSDVGCAVGFTDYSYFIRFFRLRVGYTPLQYRKKFAKFPADFGADS